MGVTDKQELMEALERWLDDYLDQVNSGAGLPEKEVIKKLKAASPFLANILAAQKEKALFIYFPPNHESLKRMEELVQKFLAK